ncbi:MAG: glycine--tRNA ligase [Nanoarchaeota archaeon]|nr:glycine--tRNA ligase [Nanoarchaeota archaeon]
MTKENKSENKIKENNEMSEKQFTVEDLATFCKKKGFVYQNSEIYGGFGGFWDYGHLGVELNNNIKQEYWRRFVHAREDVVGIDGTIIANPMVWKASGHVDCFSDILLECSKCHEKVRGDYLIEQSLKISADGMKIDEINEKVKENNIACPKCAGQLMPGKQFNLMFSTNVGPVQTDNSTTYLRPETAQLIFTNFKLVSESARMKLPFGICQIGKAFRNEISPRDFLFRVREFEQMEIEYFVHPAELNHCSHINDVKHMKVNLISEEMQKKSEPHIEITIGHMLDKKMLCQWHAYWLAEVYQWFLDMGIKKENLRLREHLKDELAHYASACFDIEYKFPLGWKEIHGSANRLTFDLTQHAKFSGKDLSYFDQATNARVVPAVIEPSQGVGRAFLAFMFDAYNDDKERGNVVLKLHPRLAPIKIGIFPLVSNKEDLMAKARKVFDMLRKDFYCTFDRSGSIGRRYARADEQGIPFCVTVDFDSLENNDVTIRSRDTTEQIRVKIDELPTKLRKMLY